MATMKNITIDVTYAELTALIAVNGLFQGVNYLITDRGDRGLLFKAASTSQLEIQGTRYMLCPASYAIGADTHDNNWIGVWNNSKTAILNDLAIWNGQVWKCILAVTEPLTAPDVNAVNWVLVPKATFANFEYIEMIFTVSYDVANDWISKQWDNKGNCFGISYDSEHNEEYGKFYGKNYCDISDWNTGNGITPLHNNKCIGIVNNVFEDGNGAFDNSLNGTIEGNKCSGSISKNEISGNINNNICSAISSNKCFGINGNSNQGQIKNNSNQGEIYNNSNIGDIEYNSNSGTIQNNSSSIPVNILYNNSQTVDITGIWATHVSDAHGNKTGV